MSMADMHTCNQGCNLSLTLPHKLPLVASPSARDRVMQFCCRLALWLKSRFPMMLQPKSSSKMLGMYFACPMSRNEILDAIDCRLSTVRMVGNRMMTCTKLLKEQI